MTEDRFLALAAAHGADIGRWPETERAAAQAFAAAQPAIASAALQAERQLEAVLAAHSVDPSATLRQRVIDSAPRARAVARTWRWITALGLGLGLAASAAAGVAAGVTLAPASVTRLISGPAPAASNDVSALADPAGDAAVG
jgi:hypothetical protein